MKIPVIKKIVEAYTLEELHKAETALYEERDIEIKISGEDEGEQLTHVLAAVFIKEHMMENSSDLKTAIREYTLRVRNSIS
ncbi:MAG: hypothetical protein COA58_06250 [Bacteroidetes bacterium]|nr:MAG: hypothetical protein COA58_06250 [Bacteroidota bacterium]